MSGGSVDTAALELLAARKAQDATTDAEKLREADQEIAEFKKAMNANLCSNRRPSALPVSHFVVLDSGPLGLLTHPNETLKS